jgi:3'(2'), 5'-bisphosphate nucleotidase
MTPVLGAKKSMMKDIIQFAEEAGKAVMEIYSRENFGTTLKENNSPLTLADTASHDIIVKFLKSFTPDWPILSEESKSIPYEVRKSWSSFWMVDPMDGTKEFIKRNGEFTVNIALIRQGTPVLGVVYAPAKETTYYAEEGKGAFKKDKETGTRQIRVDSGCPSVTKVVVSRSHAGDETESFLKKLGPFECVEVGSSLKLCQVAEGLAHLYPRFWPSMEWDTAAAQCVVLESGGSVTDLEGNLLRYNKQNLLNPYFMVSALSEETWKPFISKKG